MSAEIDTEAWVTPLAHILCKVDRPVGGCVCEKQGMKGCEYDRSEARAAIAYLLPLIVERCAEADAYVAGPCHGTVLATLRVIRAALAEQEGE